jgi:aminomuconate-semialdehyde/2-hydroxymuconate-6-semialdehyde dehydrogenase
MNDVRLQNYIDGVLQPPLSGEYMEGFQPATGHVYSNVPASSGDDVNAAVAAAAKAAPGWAATPAGERSRILRAISEGILAQLTELAEAESRDSGKPVSLAMEVDIPRAAANFGFFADAITQFSSESYFSEEVGLSYTLRQPIGVVACISPWNLPLYLFTWKIAPALAAGNAVVAKPSEITPATAYYLSQICIDARLPPGVLNIVHGTGPDVGSAIVDHPTVKAISFTGGTVTGEAISRQAAPKFKKLSLELGGKNPVMIFADADFEEMMETTVRSSFRNQGEICLCGSRIYVERPIYEKFKEEFVARTSKLVVGDPTDPDTDLGAIVSQQHLEKILSYVDLARSEGGEVLTGGNQITLGGDLADGWFMEPTVVESLPIDCRTNQEEVFGPFVTIQPFDKEDEVVQLANGTPYGLAAVVWTTDLNRAHRVASTLDSGIVWINCWMARDLRTPFGGNKQSGVGREGGVEALRFFTQTKSVTVSM